MLRGWLLSLRDAVWPMDDRGGEPSEPAPEPESGDQGPEPEARASSSERKCPILHAGRASGEYSEEGEPAPNGRSWRWRRPDEVTPEMAAEMLPTAVGMLLCTLCATFLLFYRVSYELLAPAPDKPSCQK